MDYKVEEATREVVKHFVLGKHYAKRMPQIQYAYSLLDSNTNDIMGVVTFGNSPNNNLNKLGEYNMLELNRLCIKVQIKNLASFFLGRVFELLPKPLVLVSYADSSWDHHGYVYQATNWIYTGISKGDKEYIINGKKYHRKNAFNEFGTGSELFLREKFQGGLEVIKQGDKYRYFYLLGNKTDKKKMKAELLKRYSILSYPKGENRTYEMEKS
jgi:hypothetical protein